MYLPDVVAESILHVNETSVAAFGNLVDSLEVGVSEIDALEVAVDSRGSRALGENNVTSSQTPCNEDLSKSVAALLGDLVENGIGVDLLASGRNLVLRAQGRVGSGHDVLREAVVDQVGVGQEGVDLNLVDSGLDLGERKELLQAVDGPVRHTNGLGLARCVDLLHGSPGGLGVLGQLLLDDVLALLVQLGHVLVILLGGNGPVDKEQVNVVETEVVERVLERPLDLVGLVKVVPHLGADENVLALDARVVLEEVADSGTDLVLVLVEPGAVEVSVARLQSVKSGLVGLALGALVGKGAEANSCSLRLAAMVEFIAINMGRAILPGILTPLLRVRVIPADMIVVCVLLGIWVEQDVQCKKMKRKISLAIPGL